mgnify:CR=1 FL=1
MLILRILVVDDSKATLEIVRRSLEGFGYRHLSIKKTNNPIDALSIIGQWQPHILLTDWNMPELSGIALIKAIRKKQLKTQIGMITTIDDAKQLEQAQKAGADFVLSKPFDDQELYEKLLPLVQGAEQSEIILDEIEELSEGLALPNLAQLEKSLVKLTSNELTINTIKAQVFDESKLPCIMAVFEDCETQKVRSVALLDIYAACTLAKSNPNVTNGHIERVIKTKRPSKYVMETSQQILQKVAVAFLDHQSRKSLRLKSTNFIDQSFPKLESLYKTPANRRLDISIQIPPLAQGRVTIIGF